MDLLALADDWVRHPNLRECADSDVQALATRLVKVHQYLMGPQSGPLGYLYQKQVERNRSNEANTDKGNKHQPR